MHCSLRGIIVLCLLTLLTSFGVQAATPPFYKAQKGDVTVYVLGSMHMGKAEDYPLADNVAEALRHSRLVLEVDHKALEQLPEIMPKLMCSQPCLQRYMTKAQWRQQSKLYGNQIEKQPPWLFVQVRIIQDYVTVGLLPGIGTEGWLLQQYKPLAAVNGEQIGLETLDEQLTLIAAMTDREQKIMLQSFLTTPRSKTRVMAQRLYRYWADGDSEGLLDYSLRQMQKERRYAKENQAMLERTIYQRNQRFVERLQPLLQPGKPVFLAVGALHLGGQRGVIELLRQQGFSVQKQ